MAGYRDPLQFSKAFSKHMGSSPRSSRKEHLAPADAEKGEES